MIIPIAIPPYSKYVVQSVVPLPPAPPNKPPSPKPDKIPENPELSPENKLLASPVKPENILPACLE